METLTVVWGARRSGKSFFVNNLPVDDTEYLYRTMHMTNSANKLFGPKERMGITQVKKDYRLNSENVVFEEANDMPQPQLKEMLQIVESPNVYLTLTPRVVYIESYLPEETQIPFWLRLLFAKDSIEIVLSIPTGKSKDYGLLSPMVGNIVLNNNGVWLVGQTVKNFREYHSKKTVAEVIGTNKRYQGGD